MTTQDSDPAALEIYQAHLSHLTRCLWAQDFDGFLERIAMPYLNRSQGKDFRFETHDTLRVKIAEAEHNLKASGVTELIRIGKWAVFTEPDTIMGAHVSHLFNGSHRIVEPFENRIRLVRGADGIWRETHCSNSITLKAGAFGSIDSERTGHGLPPI